jgi:hypothetical protein
MKRAPRSAGRILGLVLLWEAVLLSGILTVASIIDISTGAPPIPEIVTLIIGLATGVISVLLLRRLRRNGRRRTHERR